MKFSVTIAGHSYIKRLEQSIEKREIFDIEKSFGLDEFDVKFYGKGGATTGRIRRNIHKITTSNPDIIFLQIGGNDFTGEDNSDHQNVGEDIIQLAQALRREGAKTIFIGKLFYRSYNRFLKTKNAVEIYNNKVDMVNTNLQEASKELKNNKIFVWNMRGYSYAMKF